MESAVFKVDVRAGTVRVKNALYLGSTYAVTIEGYDYEETPPTITLSDHRGNPLAVSEVDEQDGHIISLDTQELLDYFNKGCMRGCIKAANVHCTVNTTDATLASSTMPVFWSQYYTAPSGTLTKIDVKGPKGDPGDPGPKGDKGDDGTVITARGFFHFTVDEDSHLWVHASREQDLYEMGPDGQPDLTKPLLILGDGTGGTEEGHLYYVVYDPGDGQTSRKLDLGYVKGQDGEAFIPDIDSVPTANSSNLVESGGVAQAIADAGSEQTAALNGAVATINTALGGKANASAVYTKSEVDNIVAAVKTGSRQVVESLDSVTDPQPLVIYMVAKASAQTSNIYDEYIWLVSEGVGSWEKIGDTEVDLSGYVLKETGKVLSSNDYTDGEKTKLSGIETGAQKNVAPVAPSTDASAEGKPADAKAAGDQLAGKQATISDLEAIRSGAAAGATAYQKPGTGIPATDLAPSVQTSLGKADTALQAAPVQSVNGQTGAVVLTGAEILTYIYSGGVPIDNVLMSLLANKADAADLRYALGTAQTISAASTDPQTGMTYGEVEVADRTANAVSITTAIDELRIEFPESVSGHVRDFELCVSIAAAVTTAPALAIVAPSGETIVAANADGALPQLVAGDGLAAGVMLLCFSEKPPVGHFFVKGEELKEVPNG